MQSDQSLTKTVGQLGLAITRTERRRPVTAQICEAIKAQIASQAYGGGEKLPSTRALATELGVSRTTVTAAYEQLLAEGYLKTRPGARAEVAIGPPPVPTGQRSGMAPRAEPLRLSRLGQRVAEHAAEAAVAAPAASAPAAPAIDFRYGDLAAGDFPVLTWRRLLSAALLERPPRLRYSEPAGLPALRRALQGYLWRARGLRCDVEQIVIVNGSQQALDLCARLLVDPADTVVVENPGYAMARRVFAMAGGEIEPIAVDDQGLQTAALQHVTAARLAYVTPSHQFPLGSVMSVARRRALLAWAQASGAYLIEDDYDSEYRFDTRPIETLQSLDRTGAVIYIGTFSKTLSPQLRLGYLIAPPALVPAFTALKHLTDRHTPSLAQTALASFITSGGYERHVRRVRRLNGERRATVLDALRSELGSRVEIVGAAAGLHIVVWFKQLAAHREAELVARSAAAGLGLHGIAGLFCLSGRQRAGGERPVNAGIVLGYASLSAANLRTGIGTLKKVLDAMQVGRR